jgi:hypothetical protein
MALDLTAYEVTPDLEFPSMIDFADAVDEAHGLSR